MNATPGIDDETTAPEHLVVRVDGGTGDTNYTLMIARPSGRCVLVQEWAEENRAGAPREEILDVDAVYARLERAHEARRRINVDLRRIRSWLDA